LCVDDGVVGVGDRLHEREPEPDPDPDPVGSGTLVGAVSLERFEQAGELAGRDHGSGVRDREDGVAGGGVGGEVESACGGVVTDGVLDQVRDEPLDQQGLAGGAGGLECRSWRSQAAMTRLPISRRAAVSALGSASVASVSASWRVISPRSS
jgi:hypothetical protein